MVACASSPFSSVSSPFVILIVVHVVIVVVVLAFARTPLHPPLPPLSSFYVILLGPAPVRLASRRCLPPAANQVSKAPRNVIAGLAFPTLLSRPGLGSLGPGDIHCPSVQQRQPPCPSTPPQRSEG